MDLWKQNQSQSRFDLRLEQIKGCTLPKLPTGGKLLNCSYVDNLKVVCTMQCNGDKRERKVHCFLHYGEWQGLFACHTKNGKELIQKPLQKLMQCRHKASSWSFYLHSFVVFLCYFRSWQDVWFLLQWRGAEWSVGWPGGPGGGVSAGWGVTRAWCPQQTGRSVSRIGCDSCMVTLDIYK